MSQMKINIKYHLPISTLKHDRNIKFGILVPIKGARVMFEYLECEVSHIWKIVLT